MWHAKTIEETLRELDVDAGTGLSAEEAQKRLERHGPNRLEEERGKGLLSLFLSQFKDMLIYVLLGAAAITLVVGEYVDTAVILLIVLLNAGIGVVQEHKAEKAIEALRKMASPKALVRRDGRVEEIDADRVVPGDIVLLDAGRVVPADLRLIESADLRIEESALTGESVPAEKDARAVHNDPETPVGDRTNMAYTSTLVTYGRGVGVAVATGMGTELGKIAGALKEESAGLTPLQKRLEELGRTLGFAAIGVCALIFLLALLQGRELFEMFLTALSLAVAAIPEGLPAIVAIVLALGVAKMARRGAIVRRLPAVETLGSVTVICSDKTGTLTRNKMTVTRLYTPRRFRDAAPDGEEPAGAALPGGASAEGDVSGGFHADAAMSGGAPSEGAVSDAVLSADSPAGAPAPFTAPLTDGERRLLEAFVLCSDAAIEDGKGTGDPTEVALVEAGWRFGLRKRELEARHPRAAERPFDSERKLMSTASRMGGGYRIHAKGAPDRLLDICTHALVDGREVPLDDELRAEILRAVEAMSDDALRVLAAAYKDAESVPDPGEMEKDLVFLGLAGMIDPPRAEARASIREAKMAGIRPVMITGDHQSTALAIARQLGIAESADECMTGAELDGLSEEEFRRRIGRLGVFARVSPEHKVKIVKAFQAEGHVVSMTGDGVNDAPSLKHADIGVAMGIAGTDVAKGASDMILTDDNFATIVRAVREGRTIYQNIKKSVTFLLACNLGEVLAIFAAIAFFWPLPLLATQILWVNLVTDSLPAIALGTDPADRNVMRRKPRNPRESFFARGAAWRVAAGGALIGLVTLAGFWWGLSQAGYSPGAKGIPEDALAYARTIAFAVLTGSQMMFALSMRSPSEPVLRAGLFRNRLLIGAIAISFFLQVAIISLPFTANVFHLQPLGLAEWALAAALSLVPPLANEGLKLMWAGKKSA
ncbi:MAG: ATPase [Paenibacillaceae bacterium ZCTH02-B3]|nr:MAG: ATPase [Paenibacillaceae bacterium ZCTH02-B3]